MGCALFFPLLWWPILDDLFATGQDESQDRVKVGGYNSVILPQVCMQVDYNGRWLDGVHGRENDG